MYPRNYLRLEECRTHGSKETCNTVQHSICDIGDYEISHGDGIENGTKAIVS